MELLRVMRYRIIRVSSLSILHLPYNQTAYTPYLLKPIAVDVKPLSTR